MKKLLIAALCLLSALTAAAQGWTAEELSAANTAANVKQLTTEEKEVIKYLNLARLYPRKFADLEVVDYYGGERQGQPSRLSDDRMTLIAELYELEPRVALTFAPQLLDEARCLAAEQSRNGEIGHLRHNCPSTHASECCGYGYSNGREIALQLLIDDGVEGLGHRAACLNAGLGSVAVAIDNHPAYEYGAVLDFAWGDYNARTDLNYIEADNLSKEQQTKFFALMTRHVPADLLSPRPSGTPVVNVQTAVQTRSSSDGFVKTTTETRYHADGSRQIIVTTTSTTLDGVGDTKRTVTVER